jgi:hypothetical protein
MCDLCVGSTSLEEDAHTKGGIGATRGLQQGDDV